MYTGYNYQLNANGVHRTYGDSSRGLPHRCPRRHLPTDFVTRTTTDHPDDPFLMYVNTSAPHLPMEPVGASREPSVEEREDPQAPELLRGRASATTGRGCRLRWPTGRTSSPYMDIDYQHRMGSLLAADDMIAATLDSLEAQRPARQDDPCSSPPTTATRSAPTTSSGRTPRTRSRSRCRWSSAVRGSRSAPMSTCRCRSTCCRRSSCSAGVTVPADVDGRSLASVAAW